MYKTAPADTGRKLNVNKTSFERVMYVQFTSCADWGMSFCHYLEEKYIRS